MDDRLRGHYYFLVRYPERITRPAGSHRFLMRYPERLFKARGRTALLVPQNCENCYSLLSVEPANRHKSFQPHLPTPTLAIELFLPNYSDRDVPKIQVVYRCRDRFFGAIVTTTLDNE